MGKFIDLTGNKFGRLLVKNLDYIEKYSYWVCECECGNIVSVRGNNLTGKRQTLSCGCLQKEKARNKHIDISGNIYGCLEVLQLHHTQIRENNPNWLDFYYLCYCSNCKREKIMESASIKNSKSCGCMAKENSKKSLWIDDRESLHIKLIYNNYLNGAKKRKIPFSLDSNLFAEIISKPCFYCGEKNYNKNKINRRGEGLSSEYYYNGIDRVDSSIGYTVDNCVPCCGRCNEAKMSEKQDDFKSWIEKVYNHFVKNNQ